MKLFEVTISGQGYGYLVGQNGVQSIKKTGQKVAVSVENDTIGEYTVYFDLDQLPMYTVG